MDVKRTARKGGKILMFVMLANNVELVLRLRCQLQKGSKDILLVGKYAARIRGKVIKEEPDLQPALPEC